MFNIIETSLWRWIAFLSYPIAAFVVAALIFSVTDRFKFLKCNINTKWYSNTDLHNDLVFAVLNLLLRKYLMLGITIILWTASAIVVSTDQIQSYMLRPHGIFGGLSFYAQLVAYIVFSDFCLYWIHRAFHHKLLWNYHSIHHAPKQVEWTTAYRFHPINIALGTQMVDVIFLHLGISPDVLIFLRPLDTAFSFFVHANIDINLGIFGTLIASPIFHRWHHAIDEECISKNFSSTLAIWDVLFKTYYMPSHKKPHTYGIGDQSYPHSAIGQLLYPFKRGPKLH